MAAISFPNYDLLSSKLPEIQKDYQVRDKVVFINSNELGTRESAKILKSLPFQEEGSHIGVSSWHNFDIAAQTGAKFIIIFDINNLAIRFIKKTIEVLKKNTSQEKFIDEMAEYLSKTSPRVDKGSFDSPLLRIHNRDEKKPSRVFTYPISFENGTYEFEPFHFDLAPNLCQT